MLKFHEADDIFDLGLFKAVSRRADVRATIPGGDRPRPGEIIRLTAPSVKLDDRVKVLVVERQTDVDGDFCTIDGQFVK